MGDKLTTSLTVLLTGFVVVFTVLLLLIGVIKLYGTIVYKAQTKKAENRPAEKPPVSAPSIVTLPAFAAEEDEAVDDSELIAVISAAVYSVYEKGSVKIKSVRRSQDKPKAWRNAGLSDNVRPF